MVVAASAAVVVVVVVVMVAGVVRRWRWGGIHSRRSLWELGVGACVLSFRASL